MKAIVAEFTSIVIEKPENVWVKEPTDVMSSLSHGIKKQRIVKPPPAKMRNDEYDFIVITLL